MNACLRAMAPAFFEDLCVGIRKLIMLVASQRCRGEACNLRCYVRRELSCRPWPRAEVLEPIAPPLETIAETVDAWMSASLRGVVLFEKGHGVALPGCNGGEARRTQWSMPTHVLMGKLMEAGPGRGELVGVAVEGLRSG